MLTKNVWFKLHDDPNSNQAPTRKLQEVQSSWIFDFRPQHPSNIPKVSYSKYPLLLFHPWHFRKWCHTSSKVLLVSENITHQKKTHSPIPFPFSFVFGFSPTKKTTTGALHVFLNGTIFAASKKTKPPMLQAIGLIFWIWLQDVLLGLRFQAQWFCGTPSYVGLVEVGRFEEVFVWKQVISHLDFDLTWCPKNWRLLIL